MKILLYGPPGAGKDTQGHLLATRYNVPFVSTGRLLREEMAKPEALGQSIVPYMQRGDMVPSELVDQVMAHAFARPDIRLGYVMNGFPRTANTVAWYLQREKPTLALMIDVPEPAIRFRLEERGRFDDNPGAINKRLELQRTHMPDVLAALNAAGVPIVRVDGTGEVHTVTDRILKALPRSIH
jgi:adenylate kinase